MALYSWLYNSEQSNAHCVIIYYRGEPNTRVNNRASLRSLFTTLMYATQWNVAQAAGDLLKTYTLHCFSNNILQPEDNLFCEL